MGSTAMKMATALTTVLLVVASAAAQEVPDYIGSAPTAADYPHDDGLILRQMIRVTLGTDGRVVRHEESSLKMLGEYLARYDYFDPRIDWNDARATMTVDQARTVMVDGTVVDAQANSLVPNTAPEMQWAVPYAFMRQMVVAMVGVEHGSTSTLAYTVADRAPTGVPIWGVVDLQQFVPVLDQWITLEVPAGHPLHIAGLGCQVEASKETVDGLDRYVIHRTDVPSANVAELVAGHHGLERLVFSSAADWPEVVEFLRQRVEPALVADGAVDTKTREVLDGALQDAEAVARIHRFVVEGVRTVEWPLVAFDYQVRSASQVLQSSVGHPLDKAVLLATMLRSAGFEARIALAASEPEIAAQVPSPAQLDEAWVVVGQGPHATWLDPTAMRDQRDAWDLAGHATLVLAEGTTGVEVMPSLTSDRNRAALRAQVVLSAEDRALVASGHADVDLAYRYNPLVDFDREGDRQAGLARRIAGAWGDAAVDATHVAVQQPSLTSMRVSFSGGRYEVPEHGLVRIHLPRLPGAVSGQALQAHRGRRTLPLVLPRGVCSEEVDLEVTLPEGYELAARPGDVVVSNEVGSVRRTVVVEDGVLEVHTLLVLEIPVVDAASYTSLRALMTAVMGEPASSILLRRED